MYKLIPIALNSNVIKGKIKGNNYEMKNKKQIRGKYTKHPKLYIIHNSSGM